MSGQSAIVNYKHPKERRYSATCYSDALRLLSDDPRDIVGHVFRSNALEKWKRPDILQDFKQELCLYLHEKHKGQSSLLELVNGPFFPYFLVSYTRNHVRTKRGVFTRKYGDRFVSSDEEEFEFPIMLEPEKVKEGIDLLCPKTIRWLISTDDFDAFTKKQKKLFLRYFDLLLLHGKKITIKAACEELKIDYKTATNAISPIRATIKSVIRRISNQ